jgi:predicted PurR-regulated permease PerM
MALWVIGLYAVVQSLESSVVTPLLMKQMVKLPPALTLLFQTMMAALFGFLGLLLAVPILATSKILVEELWVEDVADEH